MKVVPGQGLVVMNIHPSHQGLFVCEAANKGGSITATAMISVQVRKYYFISTGI